MDLQEPPRREPAFNVPLSLVVAIVVLLGIHLVRGLLSEMTDIGFLLDLAFVPGAWSVALGHASAADVVAAAGAGSLDPEAAATRAALARYVVDQVGLKPWTCLSYGLLHGSWLHVGLNSVWLAAFGTPVVRRAGPARVAVLALAATVGGAIAQWLADPLSTQPMIGASAAVSGIMAAAATFVFRRPAADWLPAEPRGGPDWSFVGNRGAMLFLGSWFVVNLLFGLLATPLGFAGGAIAWQAHIGGLLVGLLLFPVLDTGARR